MGKMCPLDNTIQRFEQPNPDVQTLQEIALLT